MCFRSQSSRLLLEICINKDGYFNNDMLMLQVAKTVDVFEAKHPGKTGVFIFDQAPSHKKKAADALDAKKMNVGPGGKQPAMRSTVWKGQRQSLILPDGTPKGLKSVLQERGIDTASMKRPEMVSILSDHADFKEQRTILHDFLTEKSHVCLYFPKYHCELNPIECCWCHSKKHTRQHSNYSIVRLRKTLPEGLATVTPDLISKFCKRVRQLEAAYRGEDVGQDVSKAVHKLIAMVYQSHRRALAAE